MTVLKGESLINDAAALTMFAVLVAIATGTHAFIDSIPCIFFTPQRWGLSSGLIIGNLAQWVRRLLASPALSTAFSVAIPFAAYLTAEEFHAIRRSFSRRGGLCHGAPWRAGRYEERMQGRQFLEDGGYSAGNFCLRLYRPATAIGHCRRE
jgi:NhaP-type Na+/H+ or K+/H+ antiporter